MFRNGTPNVCEQTATIASGREECWGYLYLNGVARRGRVAEGHGLFLLADVVPHGVAGGQRQRAREHLHCPAGLQAKEGNNQVSSRPLIQLARTTCPTVHDPAQLSKRDGHIDYLHLRNGEDGA